MNNIINNYNFILINQNLTFNRFMAYKLPHTKHHQNKFIKNGYGYVYITSRDNDEWLLSDLSINSPDSVIGATLNPLYKNKNIVHILYNDEPLNKNPKANKGHTKGVVLADESGGIWLVHSVPLFPPLPTDSYSYPSSGTLFGQSFLCLSLDLKTINQVGTQLQYNEPQIYSFNFPDAFISKLPELYHAAMGKTITTNPWFNVLSFLTTGKNSFSSFAKSKHFNKDLYEDWLAPALESNLLVQTWPNGPGRMPSNCTLKFR